MDIKSIIDKWDPINLFPYAPNDEYEVEIKLIQDYVNENMQELNQQSLGIQIKTIFEKRFGDDIFRKDNENCIKVANEIIQQLK